MNNGHLVKCLDLERILLRQSYEWGNTNRERYLELMRQEVAHRETCNICNPALIADELVAELFGPGAVVMKG